MPIIGIIKSLQLPTGTMLDIGDTKMIKTSSLYKEKQTLNTIQYEVVSSIIEEGSRCN